MNFLGNQEFDRLDGPINITSNLEYPQELSRNQIPQYPSEENVLRDNNVDSHLNRNNRDDSFLNEGNQFYKRELVKGNQEETQIGNQYGNPYMKRLMNCPKAQAAFLEAFWGMNQFPNGNNLVPPQGNGSFPFDEGNPINSNQIGKAENRIPSRINPPISNQTYNDNFNFQQYYEQQNALNPNNSELNSKRFERMKKIERYKQKKRNWNKTISYDCRKKVAEKRLRIEGRFISKEETHKIERLLKNEKETFNGKNNLNLGNLKMLLSLVNGNIISQQNKCSNKELLGVVHDILSHCTTFYNERKMKMIESKIFKNDELFKFYNLHDPIQEILCSESQKSEQIFLEKIQISSSIKKMPSQLEIQKIEDDCTSLQNDIFRNVENMEKFY